MTALPRRRHVYVGWPGMPCRMRRWRRNAGRCGLPREAPIHVNYPCPVCGEVRWSVEARLTHIESSHPLSRKAWERQ